MKRPMTTAELFQKINSILKEKGLLPDILDYGLGPLEPKPIPNYEFDVGNSLRYGGSEGIYLSLWIDGCENGKDVTHKLGTYKTLSRSDEAMHTMAKLLADFIIEECHYVNANLDDFTWEGSDVYPVDESGQKSKGGYTCGTMERALKRKDELLQKYPKVIVRDNATRKEIVYVRECDHDS